MSTQAMPTDEKTIGDFSDKEIQDEYIERFGDPDEPDLKDFTAHDLIEELEDRDALPEAEIDDLDEIADMLAEAARVSPHARKAYQLLREQFGLPIIEARQSIIAGRMGDAA